MYFMFPNDAAKCGDSAVHSGEEGGISEIGLTAWGDDIATEEKDGFERGEGMVFKFYDASLDAEYVTDDSVFSTVSSAGRHAFREQSS